MKRLTLAKETLLSLEARVQEVLAGDVPKDTNNKSDCYTDAKTCFCRSAGTPHPCGVPVVGSLIAL
jgi:hypothetical protein